MCSKVSKVRVAAATQRCAQRGDDCIFRLGLGFEGLLAWHLNGDLAESLQMSTGSTDSLCRIYANTMQTLCKRAETYIGRKLWVWAYAHSRLGIHPVTLVKKIPYAKEFQDWLGAINQHDWNGQSCYFLHFVCTAGVKHGSAQTS